MELAVDEDGADGLELDLQRTRDGEVIVLHDTTVDRTTNAEGAAAKFSLHELREFDAGHQFRAADGSYPYRGQGLQIPTLSEVLDRFPHAWLSLDLKEGDVQAEQRATHLLRAKRALDRVVLGAESPQAAARLRRLAPECDRFLDRREVRRFYRRHRTRVWWGYRPPGSSLQIPFRWKNRWIASRRLVDDAHAQGLNVRFWTVNDPAEMSALLDLGADGLITDHPLRLREVLREKGIA